MVGWLIVGGLRSSISWFVTLIQRYFRLLLFVFIMVGSQCEKRCHSSDEMGAQSLLRFYILITSKVALCQGKKEKEDEHLQNIWNGEHWGLFNG